MRAHESCGGIAPLIFISALDVGERSTYSNGCFYSIWVIRNNCIVKERLSVCCK